MVNITISEALSIKLGEVPEWMQQRYKSKWKHKKESKHEKEEKQEAQHKEKLDKKRKFAAEAKEELLKAVQQCPSQDSTPSFSKLVYKYVVICTIYIC